MFNNLNLILLFPLFVSCLPSPVSSLLSSEVFVNCNIAPVAQSLVICDGDSTFLQGSWQTLAGVYNDTVNAGCCDSIFITTLTINPIDFTQTTANICQGDSMFLAGNWQTASGVYSDSYLNISQCDSSIETTLTVNPSYNLSNTVTICDTDSIFLQGAWQTSAGSYTDAHLTTNGCDSIIQTTLAINPSFNTTSTATICGNDSIFLAGAWQNSTGVYVDANQSVNGCDSSVSTTLMVNPTYNIAAAETICDNDSIFLAGAWQTSAGTYSDLFQTASGCDSIVQTTVSENSSYSGNASTSICDNDSIFLENAWQTSAGTYTDVFQTASGCDSTIATTITLDPTFSITDAITISEPDSAFLAGAWQTTSGIYTDTYLATNGCDSVVVTTLEVIVGLSETGWEHINVAVYPNPLNDATNLDFSAASLAPAELTVFNATGKLVRQQSIPRGGKAVLQRGDLAPGLYYFELDISDTGKALGKLIVQ
jgi:hypothetical protein